VARRILRSLAGSGRRTRPLAALALVAVVGVVIAVVTSASSPSPGAASSDPGVSGAATVQRRDLVATDTEAGTLSYSGPQTVYDRLSGTITWLPAVGRVIKPGGTLYKVDGEPVILLNGTTPAYRTLSPADSDGADITQLNRNLVDLGFDPDGIVIDDIWQPATTIGVELFQESLGGTATGILSLGQVVFLPGEQLVSTVEGTLGGGPGAAAADTPAAAPAAQFVSLRTGESTCPGSGTSTTTSTTTRSCTTTTTPPTTTTPTTTTSPTTTTPTTTSPTTTTPTHTRKPTSTRRRHSRRHAVQQTLAALTALLKAESAQLKAEAAELRADRAGAGNGKGGSPAPSTNSGSPTSSSGSGGTGGSGSGGSGSSGSSGSGGGTPVLQTTSTHLVVTVDLSASSQSEAVVGERVTVEMPAGNTVNGRITAVSPVAESSSGSGSGGNSGSGAGSGGGGGGGGSGGSSSTIPVTITLNGHHTGAGLDQAAVSVNFVQQRARNVLSVPVTALLATAGGNFAVQTAAKPHQVIPVTTGLFAAGYVQISGPGVYSGLQVTDSQG
jgi:hypothetical protein